MDGSIWDFQNFQIHAFVFSLVALQLNDSSPPNHLRDSDREKNGNALSRTTEAPDHLLEIKPQDSLHYVFGEIRN